MGLCYNSRQTVNQQRRNILVCNSHLKKVLMIKRQFPPFCPFFFFFLKPARIRHYSVTKQHINSSRAFYTLSWDKKSQSFFSPIKQKNIVSTHLSPENILKEGKEEQKILYVDTFLQNTVIPQQLPSVNSLSDHSHQAHSAVMSLELRIRLKLKESLLFLLQSLCFLTFIKKSVILTPSQWPTPCLQQKCPKHLRRQPSYLEANEAANYTQF